MSKLTNNSVNCFTTRIDDKDANGKFIGVIDVTEFTEAVYRVFASDNRTVLIEARLSTGQITIEDSEYNGATINRFKTIILKSEILDDIAPEGIYQHQFKVTNSIGYELPPVFQGNVTIERAHEPD